MLYFIIFCVIVWVLLSGYILPFYKKKVQDPDTISRNEIEDIYINARIVAIQTSPRDETSKYEQAYYRCKSILYKILLTHECYILDMLTQLKYDPMFYFDFSEEAKIRIDTKSLTQYSDDFLFAASLVYFNGWFFHNYGTVSEDKCLCLTLTDYLIKNRSCKKAWLMKGLIFKYGIDVYCKPNIVEAKKCLTKAVEYGVGTAIEELRQIDKHMKLEHLKYSDNDKETTWEQRSFYDQIESYYHREE